MLGMFIITCMYAYYGNSVYRGSAERVLLYLAASPLRRRFRFMFISSMFLWIPLIDGVIYLHCTNNK